MATTPISSTADRAAQTAQTQNTATSKTASPEKGESKQVSMSEIKSQLNARIVETSLSVSLRSGDKSLSLLYRSVLNGINEAMGPELGKNPIQNGSMLQQDNSPEATADRILSFATGFFDSYAKQHPGEDPDKLAENFVKLVRGGFEKGFNEAKDILDGMGVLGGSDVEKGIMKTYDLVSKGFDDFLASKLKPKEDNDVGTQPVTGGADKVSPR